MATLVSEDAEALFSQEISKAVSGDGNLAGRAQRKEDYKERLAASYAETAAGRVAWAGKGTPLIKGIGASPAARRQLAEQFQTLEKSLTGDQLASFGGDLTAVKEYVTKDWTPSNPVGGTGLTPYDLEGPAKVLVPLHTPLRNNIPRSKGVGTARKFKRIDSFSNAGIPGGAATMSPTFNSLTQTSTWGPTGNVTLARPPKISYTGSDHSVTYVELGLSDSVDYVAQFQGLGFDDLRALSHTALLYAHLMGEERQMLYGRGASGLGYEGDVSAPVVTSATGTGSGGALTGTYYVYVTANTGFGESLPSTVVTTGALTGATQISILIGTEPQGAINYNVYIGTTTGIANAKFQGNFAGNPIVVTAVSTTSPVAGNTDTSYQANGYDGFLSVQSDPALTGYFKRANAKLSTTNPGVEFDTALETMFVNNGADPDEIWMDGAVRAEYNQLMRVGGTSGAASGYRTNVETGDGNAILGTVVGGHLNPNTTKVVKVATHRFQLSGAALIRSLTVPIPLANVTAPVEAINVQDYMAIDWAQIQLTYDVSTYQIGTLVHYAPAWNGLIVGLQ